MTTRTEFIPVSPEKLSALPDGAIVVHADPDGYENIMAQTHDFFRKLYAKAQQEHTRCYVVGYPNGVDRIALKLEHTNLIFGDLKAGRVPALHLRPSYLCGFWYMDAYGVYARSSIGERSFRAHEIDTEAATYFFNAVSGSHISENKSKSTQPPVTGWIPSAKAVVFLQDGSPGITAEPYLATHEMIAHVAHSTDERIYVKCHPNASAADRLHARHVCSQFDHVEITEQSVHALIRASAYVVTQNSAAGFEALMQKKPVITCAPCDYHEATYVARDYAGVEHALNQGATLLKSFSYEAYFYWFMAHHMLEPQMDEFETRVWARIAALREAQDQLIHRKYADGSSRAVMR
ncbi:MAG: hypothetical protein ACPGVK_03410 [Halocynthiibacter sp.]